MISQDKILHCVVCYDITLTLGLFLPIYLAILIAVLLSLGKELYDLYGNGTPDRYDLIADSIGILLAFCLILIYNKFILI